MRFFSSANQTVPAVKQKNLAHCADFRDLL
jgi:hypothetical protein